MPLRERGLIGAKQVSESQPSYLRFITRLQFEQRNKGAEGRLWPEVGEQSQLPGAQGGSTVQRRG